MSRRLLAVTRVLARVSRSSLARLAALVRPLMGGSGDTGRPTQPSGPEADPQLPSCPDAGARRPCGDGARPRLQQRAAGGRRQPRPDCRGGPRRGARPGTGADGVGRPAPSVRRGPAVDDCGPARRGIRGAKLTWATSSGPATMLAEPLTRPGIELSVRHAAARAARPDRSRPDRAGDPEPVPQCARRHAGRRHAAHHDADGDLLGRPRRWRPRAFSRDLCGGGRVGYGAGHPAAPARRRSSSRSSPPSRPARAAASGLAMVRETVVAHGGLVELTSDRWVTTVRILLPLCLSRAAAGGGAVSAAASPAARRPAR